MKNVSKQNLAIEETLEETIFGYKLQDNYRYFEDLKSEKALRWMKKQTEITKDFINEENLSESIYKELLDLENYKEYTYNRIVSKDNFIYYAKRHYTDFQMKICKTNIITKEETLLIDFSEFEKNYDADKVILSYFNVSPKEKFISFTVGINGEETGYLHFYNLENNKVEKYFIKNNRTPCEWIDDNSFIYFNYPHFENEDDTKFKEMEMVFHKFNSNSKDVILFSEKTTKVLDDLGEIYNYFFPKYHEKSKKLYVFHLKSTDGIFAFYVSDFSANNSSDFNFKKIFSFNEKIKSNLEILNDKFYFTTSYFTKELQLRYCNIEKFDIKNSLLIETPKDEFLQSLHKTKNNLYFLTIKNAYNKLYKLDLKTNKYINIPTKSNGIIQINETENNELIFLSTNYKTPYIYYYVDKKNAVKKHEIVNSKINIDFSDIELITEEYKSYDGTKIPITYAFKKGIKLNGKNKCLINAYGSYGMSMTSYFSITNYRWIKNGGIIVIAHVRGGGENGEKWHKAGQKETKHNSWKDLISAGEYMIAKKYTSTPYMACQGTSAGGITVGMTANERPDLFGAILSNVGSNTVIRKGKNPAGGWYEFGNPNIENEFKHLLKMDVFQNIKCDIKYPNMLFTAGKDDGRVDYWQPAKACAKMQKCTSSNNRIAFLLYEQFGHGNLGASKKDSYRYMANQFAFLEKVLK